MTAVSLDLRRVFAAYPTGVAALAGLVDGAPVGLAAASFVPVSLDPPLVSVCIAHTSSTWPVLRRLPRVGISVLAANQDHAGQQLGARTGDRFAALSWRSTADGAVLLDGAAAWFDCSVVRHVPAGDHDIVLFAIHDLDGDAGTPPLVFHGSRYRALG